MDDPLTEINAAIGTLARATSSIDMYLTVFLAEILHPAPLPNQDLELASIMVQSQSRIEGRINIVRDVLALNLRRMLHQPQHTYPHKLAIFIMKAFNKIAINSTAYVWVRNLASHGVVYVNEIYVVGPQVADYKSEDNLKRQRNRDPKNPFPANETGFTAAELLNCAEEIGSISHLVSLKYIMEFVRFGHFEGEELEKRVVNLGRELQLQAPLQVRPPRKAKPPRG